jgi:hypothetical protein|tara:strand:+ start:690 stop:824 length:135 start_codon:yes stop_codon:yes gene_type:complete
MPRGKKTTHKKTTKKNIEGNWRGIEDAFFNKVRKGFQRIFGPKY